MQPDSCDPPASAPCAPPWAAAPCGLLLADAGAAIARCNATLAGWVGVPAPALAGRRVADLLTPPGRAVFEADLRPRLRDHGGFDEAPLVLLAASGATRPVLATARADAAGGASIALFDASGAMRDLATARAEAEATRACLFAVLDRSADCVAVLDAAMAPVFENARARLAFRLPGVAQRAPLLAALTPAEASWLAAACAAVRRGGETWVRERRIERPNVWVEFSLVPIGRLVVVVFADVSARRAAEAERSRAQARQGHLARHDALTGLPNRLDFRDRLDEALRGGAAGGRCALLVLDLDHFRQVNDTWGQATGDAVLRQVAERLRAEVHGPDCVVRLGGDEFAVLVTGLAAASGAGRLAARIVARLGEPFGVEGRRVGVGASVGIALGPDDAATAAALMGLADTALSAAKRAGGNTYRFAAD